MCIAVYLMMLICLFFLGGEQMREQLVTENRQKFQKVAKVRFSYSITYIDICLYTNINISYNIDMKTNININMNIDVVMDYQYKHE